MTEQALQLGKEAQELRNSGDSKGAMVLVEQLIPLIDKSQPFFVGQIYGFYANLHNDLNDLDESVLWYNKSKDVYDQGGFKSKVNHVNRHIAEIETKRGNTKEARDLYEKVLVDYRSDKTHAGELANTLRGYALLIEATEGKDSAKIHWQETRNLYDSLGIKEGVEECDKHIN